ncbi:helix-turn-helix transcriptional regulator [Nonomuraea sp. NPDC046570]|uniref:helix-turn-helix domain-containing protein n=1 Tax=Nonomuraea sp. NPDC046570 TaxID=3155255 RepID=UPI0033E47CE7
MDEKRFHPAKFRLIRIKAGYGRAELAKKAKMHKVTIKEWERGYVQHRISSPHLTRCAQVLGCSVDDFMEPADWLPCADDLALLKRHKEVTALGYHGIESPNPRSVPVRYGEWLSGTQSDT